MQLIKKVALFLFILGLFSLKSTAQDIRFKHLANYNSNPANLNVFVGGHKAFNSMDSATFFKSHSFGLMFWFGASDFLASAFFGMDLMSNGLYFLILTPMLFLEHANFKYPKWLDKTIWSVITTPNLRKVHHDRDAYYNNSNYADLFIFWDCLFGNYKYKPVEEINLGSVKFDEPKKQTFCHLIKSPFISKKSNNITNKIS